MAAKLALVRMLNSWIEHRIAHDRLNQRVRFDFEGLDVKGREEAGALDRIAGPSFGEMRGEATAFLDGSIRPILHQAAVACIRK